MRARLNPVLVVLLVAGCGGPSPGGSKDVVEKESQPVCKSDVDCDDDRFCNGAEVCSPGDRFANALGCVLGEPPCDLENACIETTKSCSLCPDADFDGHREASCGGDDCDDEDPARFPGAVEVCDAKDRDEDCDPTTFGVRDLDGDGEVDLSCCNADGKSTHCGKDCDDTRPGVSTTSPEVCNLIDDDCDGEVDEDVKVLLLPDADGDGYGDDAAATHTGCVGTPGYSTLGGDCNDSAPGLHLGSAEVCNGVDDDCDGLTDDVKDGDVFCVSGTSSECVTSAGVPGLAACATDCLGYEKCFAPEVCNGIDDDGDGPADETFDCVLGSLNACMTSCGTSGVQQCGAGCTKNACVANEICNFCDDDGVLGIAGESALATASDGPRILAADGIATPAITTRVAGVAEERADSVERGYETFVRLLDGSAPNQVGAYWVELERYQGWGATMIVADVRVSAPLGDNPMGGWSLVIATGGSGDVGEAKQRGVPMTRKGARLDWIWGMPKQDVVDLDDRVAYGTIQQWRGEIFAGPYPVTGVPTQGPKFDGQTTAISQSLVFIYEPENPFTLAREEKVRIAFPGTGGASCATTAECALGQSCVFLPTVANGTCLSTVTYKANSGTSGVDPANDIPLGSVLSVGITAGTYEYTFTASGAPMSFTVGGPVVMDVKLKRFQEPPSGSNLPPVTIPYSTISRDKVCPGGY